DQEPRSHQPLPFGRTIVRRIHLLIRHGRSETLGFPARALEEAGPSTGAIGGLNSWAMFRWARPFPRWIGPMVSWISLMVGCSGGASDRDVGAEDDGDAAVHPVDDRVVDSADAQDDGLVTGSLADGPVARRYPTSGKSGPDDDKPDGLL